MVVLYLLCAGGILAGIRWMSSPKTAVKGNLFGSLAVLIAVVAVLWAEGLLVAYDVWLALLIGAGIGLFFGRTISMMAMPQFVAVLNGLGGSASALIALAVLLGSPSSLGAQSYAASLALLVGGLTLSGSGIAAGKLSGVLPGHPVHFPRHQVISGMLAAFGLLLFAWTGATAAGVAVGLLLVVGLTFGVVFTLPIGGADMPVTISLLNSFSGLAGAIAGFSVSNPLVVAAGGIVGAAGLILTQIMCKGMNRNLAQILTGKTTTKNAQVGTAGTMKKAASVTGAAKFLKEAETVIIVPGYGMAVSQAQDRVKELMDFLLEHGKDVRIAIHPVAGRMPGHMNVLLAEVDVSYEYLFSLEQINARFSETDVVVIVGANDVVNPAALTEKDSAIYGMPILNAHQAKHVIAANFDTLPGYAGVPNQLYNQDNCQLLLGDAKQTLVSLLRALKQGTSVSGLDPSLLKESIEALSQARRVVIVPGYGMAVAQAQAEVKRLMQALESLGCRVQIAIHPVAGRMPGHMNVLLAEVDVPYDKLFPLEEINDQFPNIDVTVIVGANDVVNPAALEAQGTAIFGMPILHVHQSRKVIVCNFDTKAGYSGTDNPLYESPQALLLLGDAKKTLQQVNQGLAALETANQRLA